MKNYIFKFWSVIAPKQKKLEQNGFHVPILTYSGACQGHTAKFDRFTLLNFWPCQNLKMLPSEISPSVKHANRFALSLSD